MRIAPSIVISDEDRRTLSRWRHRRLTDMAHAPLRSRSRHTLHLFTLAFPAASAPGHPAPRSARPAPRGPVRRGLCFGCRARQFDMRAAPVRARASGGFCVWASGPDLPDGRRAGQSAADYASVAGTGDSACALRLYALAFQAASGQSPQAPPAGPHRRRHRGWDRDSRRGASRACDGRSRAVRYARCICSRPRFWRLLRVDIRPLICPTGAAPASRHADAQFDVEHGVSPLNHARKWRDVFSIVDPKSDAKRGRLRGVWSCEAPPTAPL